MGNSRYKNVLKLREVEETPKVRYDLMIEPLEDRTPLPKTLEYKDIDIAFKEWVDTALGIAYEDKKIETIALFTNQRFSEYMQSWQYADENRNMLLNFKVITRENNPKKGTIQGGFANIPGDRFYFIQRNLMEDKNGRHYFLDYKMKQPFAVDLIYKLSIVTNKYELLNEFNTLVNDKFKAIQCYICPNGHYLPMTLENISDESNYSINDRMFFSQSFDIKVAAYIIRKEDLIAEENPIFRVCSGIDSVRNTAKVELIEDECSEEEPLNVVITLKGAENSVKFIMPCNFTTTSINVNNIRGYRFSINDVENYDERPIFYEGDIVKFYKISKIRSDASITFKGK